MSKGYFKFLVVVMLQGAVCNGDNGCSRPRGCHQPANCSSPKDSDNETGTDDEGTFVPGPAQGEVAGESNSLGLRLGTLRIPEVAISLPTVQLPSFVRFRKNAVMHTESGTAPFVRGDLNEFGLDPRTPSDPETGKDDKDESEAGPGCVPPCPNYYPQQCLPPCGEGCTTKLMKNPATDPWRNSAEHQVAVREEQVAKLESQVTELQKLVERLAIEKSEAANAEPASAPHQRPRSQAINPWSQNSAPVQSAEVDARDEQAEQIAMLQARIEEMSKERQGVNKSAASEDDIAEPLIRQEPKQAERELPKRDKSTAKSGVFSRFGMALSRR